MRPDLAANDNLPAGATWMMLKNRLPALQRLPAQDVYKCTA